MKSPKPFTTEQEQFIRNNYEDLTHEQMAVYLRLSVNRVSYYCTLNNLRKKPGPKFISKYATKRPIPAPTKPGKHWAPDHDNPSREDHIERILNVQI